MTHSKFYWSHYLYIYQKKYTTNSQISIPLVSFIGFMFKNHSHQVGEVDQEEWLSIPCNYQTDCTYESIGDTRKVAGLLKFSFAEILIKICFVFHEFGSWLCK